MKKRILTLTLISILVISLYGCNTKEADKTKNATATLNITTPITSTPSPDTTPGIKPFKAMLDNDKQRFINFWLAGVTPTNYGETEYFLDTYLPAYTPNCVDIWVCWKIAEPEQGKFDFEMYDSLIDKVASYGCKVYLRINTMDLPAWIYTKKDENGKCIYTQWDSEGNDIVNSSSTGGVRAGILSYANPEARQFALDYTKAVVEHFTERYKDWPGGNPIRLYASCFSHCGEMEFYFGYESSDYSPAAITAFRNWLKNRYLDISLLNERWGTKYKSFDDVAAPRINNNTETVQEMDWLEYRAYEQGRIIKDQADTVHVADPNASYVMVFGSVFDEMIKRRGALFADYWADYVDWIGVADAINYNHRYSTSLLRGISKGGGIYNEAFRENSDNAYLRSEWGRFTEECFDEGVNQMNYAGFPFRDLGNSSYDYYKVGEEYIANAQEVVRPKPKRAIYMSTWSITRDTATITMSEGEQIFNKLREEGYIDIIRDGTFENDVDYLVNTYTDIYFASNQYISDSARAALLEAQKRGVILHDANCVMDKYGNARLSFDKINTDKTAPKVKAVAGKGLIAGIASDVGSGISKIEVAFSDGKVMAKGTDTWSISTDGKTGKATITAYDNNGNKSAAVIVTVK